MSDTGIDQQTPEAEAKSTTEAEAEPTAEAEPVAEAEPAAEAPARTGQPVSDEPAGAAPGASRARRVVTIGLAAVVLAGFVVVGLLGWRAFNEWRAQGDREAALDAARTGTTAVLTYSSKTLDADLARAHAAIAGGFVAKFDALTNSSIVPAARQRDLASKATVLHAALLDNGAGPTDRPDQLQALVFVNHTTFENNQPQPRSPSSQLKVTMTRTNGKWLITDLRPL